MKTIAKYIFFIYFCTTTCWSMLHDVYIKNDARKTINLGSFGVYKGGAFEVRLVNFRSTPENHSNVFGFSFEKVLDNSIYSYIGKHHDQCVLQDKSEGFEGNNLIYFKIDVENKRLRADCNWYQTVRIYSDWNHVTDAMLCRDVDLEIYPYNVHGWTYASFILHLDSLEEEGRYNIFFHNCPNYDPDTETFVDFTLHISEHNSESYLSAGDMPLPTFYWMMFVLFLLSGMFWEFFLKHSKQPISGLHHWMTAVVFLKAATFASHSLCYYDIARSGVWQGLWYNVFVAADVTTNAVFFFVLFLVGCGYNGDLHIINTTRLKHIDSALFTLQSIAGLIEVMTQSFVQEGAAYYVILKNCLILTDLLCWIFVLLPIIWCIKQLEGDLPFARKTFQKITIFRSIFALIIYYIFSTRIMTNVLKFILPFRHEWLREVYREISTYIFFVIMASSYTPTFVNTHFPDDEKCGIDSIKVPTKAGDIELKKINYGYGDEDKVGLHEKILTEISVKEKDSLLEDKEKDSLRDDKEQNV